MINQDYPNHQPPPSRSSSLEKPPTDPDGPRRDATSAAPGNLPRWRRIRRFLDGEMLRVLKGTFGSGHGGSILWMEEILHQLVTSGNYYKTL